MTVWFTADTHFGHKKIINYCNRPFANIEEHDSTLLKNINDIVEKTDMLWVLGDFAFQDIRGYREAINCWNVNIIWGNHDKWRHEKKYDILFQKKRDQYLTHIAGQPIFLNHYPMRSWHLSHYGAWHLFGHVHGAFDKDPLGYSMDIGVDSHNFKPLSFEQIREVMNNRRQLIGLRSQINDFEKGIDYALATRTTDS